MGYGRLCKIWTHRGTHMKITLTGSPGNVSRPLAESQNRNMG